MRRNALGFTLIELIVVITILGILSAIAMPRFIAAQRDARVSKAQALFGSVRSASSLARSRCELDLSAVVAGGTCTAAAGTVTMDGVAVAMVNRFPAATLAGIVAAAQMVDASDGVVTVAGGALVPLTITINGATNAATCVISYTEATAAGVAPIITVNTAGC